MSSSKKMRLRKFLVTVLAVAAVTGSAHGGDDTRLITQVYDPKSVVTLTGRAGLQATVAFADNERIENVAIGDSTSWQVTPNKRANLLFVKPLGERARTNMTVVTDRRMYVFDLVASATAAPFYVMSFIYPNEPKEAVQVAGGLSTDEALAVAAPPKDVAAPDPARLNFSWRTDGDRRLLPSRIYDDGEATYMSWPTRSSIPAILTRNEKGEEGAVNYAVRGDVLVLDTVPKLIVLRSGRDMATLENQAAPVNLTRAALAPVAAPAPVSLTQAAPPRAPVNLTRAAQAPASITQSALPPVPAVPPLTSAQPGNEGQ
jgi:type IV secretion system protein VirB9